jgi:hypothetical protein
MCRRRREDNIKIDLIAMGFCLMDWMILARDMNMWRFQRAFHKCLSYIS